MKEIDAYPDKFEGYYKGVPVYSNEGCPKDTIYFFPKGKDFGVSQVLTTDKKKHKMFTGLKDKVSRLFKGENKNRGC